MNQVNIELHPEQSVGAMRNILGMCNSPMVSYVKRSEKQEELRKLGLNDSYIRKQNMQQKCFRDLNLRCVRHHDASLENPSFDLVDISRIFPIFSLDENDPANYVFADTDDYFECLKGQEIEFRLGETIDHSGNSRRVGTPADFEKWARIGLNIIRHYKDGWGGGMHLNITRVTVWEEPDTICALFTEPFSTYCEMFRVTERVLHEAYPELQVGGPVSARKENWEPFVKYLAENKIRLDFFAFTIYMRDFEVFRKYVRDARAVLDRYGYCDTTVCAAEWNMAPYDWGRISEGNYGQTVNAALAASALAELTDEAIDIAFFYRWFRGNFGVFNNAGQITKTYYGLKFYADVVKLASRIHIDAEKPQEVSLLAAEEGGTVRLLISQFAGAQSSFAVSCPGYEKCTKKTISENAADNSPEIGIPLEADKNGNFRFTFFNGGSVVYLLEFTK